MRSKPVELLSLLQNFFGVFGTWLLLAAAYVLVVAASSLSVFEVIKQCRKTK
ncbi:MAG: hypothetical protein ACREBG_19115 [Pyrinomonadaceae bacterium]